MPDPDLEIREGGSHPGPEIRGGVVISQNIFSPFRPQFGLQNKGGPGPPDPSPGSSTEIYHQQGLS